MILASPPSSGASLRAVELRLGPSWYQAGILLVMHVGALVFLAPLALPLALKGVLSLMVVASLVHTLAHALRRRPGSLVRLAWSEQGEWELEDQAGRRLKADLGGASYLHPRLVVLNFRERGNGRSHPVVITPDAVLQGNLGQLRVLLRLLGR